MILMLISLSIVVICFSFFSLSYQINGLNRVVVGTPISLIENAVYDSGYHAGKINKGFLESYLTFYYNFNLKKYTPNYNMSLYFYSAENESFCTTNYCTGVEVTITAELNFNYQYERIMYYEILTNGQ